MTAIFYFPSRAVRLAMRSAATSAEPELPLSGAPDAPAPADAGSSPGCTKAPASAGPFHGCAGVPVRAMEDVLAERMRVILDFGHTPEKDLQLPLAWLPQEARNYLTDAIDEAHRGPDRHAIARRKLIKAGALLLAAIVDPPAPDDEGADLPDLHAADAPGRGIVARTAAQDIHGATGVSTSVASAWRRSAISIATEQMPRTMAPAMADAQMPAMTR